MFSGICRLLGKIWRNLWSRDSSVGITNRLWVGRSGDRISVEGDIFRTLPERSWGLLSLRFNDHRVSFPWVKRPQRGVGHRAHLGPGLKKE